MERLTMKVTTEVTDANGKKTVEDVLTLGAMKLIDVVRMQRKMVQAIDHRLAEQEAELTGVAI